MNCKHCESDNVVSAGPNLLCKNCGRHSVKIRRLNIIPLENRPLCPQCGADKPYSLSKKYICRVCGRNYLKEYSKVDKVEISKLEVQVE